MSGAIVRFARLTAMFGSPTPTKQTRWPASSRAAATIIISDLVKGWSLIEAAPRRRPQSAQPGAGMLGVPTIDRGPRPLLIGTPGLPRGGGTPVTAHPDAV